VIWSTTVEEEIIGSNTIVFIYSRLLPSLSLLHLTLLLFSVHLFLPILQLKPRLLETIQRTIIMASPLIIAALLGVASAQTSTLSIPFYGYDNMPIVASVVAANPSATTLQLACSQGTDASDCGLFPYQTLIYGPSTYHMDMSIDGDAFTMTQDCSRAASTASCAESASGSEANDPGASTATYAAEDLTTLPVTVTSGAEKLGASAQATASGSANASGSVSASGSRSAASGSAASTTTASVTQIVGSSSASASGASHTGTASATPSAGAASINYDSFHASFLGAVVALFGTLLM
jgi:hypothetical protein